MIYAQALRELNLIVDQKGIPRAVVLSAARLCARIDICLVTARDDDCTPHSSSPAVRLDASPAFLEYLSAARMREWRRAVVIAKTLLAVNSNGIAD